MNQAQPDRDAIRDNLKLFPEGKDSLGYEPKANSAHAGQPFWPVSP